MKTSSVYKKKFNRKGNATAKNQDGIVLVLSLVFLCILALLGSTAVVLTTTDMKIGGNYKNNTQAFSAAQAGVAEAFTRLKGPSTADGYAGDSIFTDATGPDSWWSAYILTSATWTTVDDLEYNANYQNYFPSGTNFTSTTASVNTLQSTVDVNYFVKIKHKREYDAEQAGHVAGTDNHYDDNDTISGTNPLSSPGSIIYFGDPDLTDNTKEWKEFTLAPGRTPKPKECRPVEIVRSYGESNGSLAVVEVEVRNVPLNLDVEAAVYSKGNLTGNGTALNVDGVDDGDGTGILTGCTNGGAGTGIQPLYVYDDPAVAGAPVINLNGVDENDGTDELTGVPDDPAQRIGPVDINIDGFVQSMGFPGSADYIIMDDESGVDYGADGDGNSVVCYSDTSDPNFEGGSTLKLSNVNGFGILAVKGDLELAGGFSWHGLVLCTGTMTFNGGGSGVNIVGAVLANYTVTINGGLDIDYDSCYIQEALTALSVVKSRWSRVY